MYHAIILAPAAATGLKSLPARRRAEVEDAIEMHLRHEPGKVSKSGIKRLRGLSRPQYRLRVGDIRIFYDLAGGEVRILAVITKAEAATWLRTEGAADEDSRTGEG